MNCSKFWLILCKIIIHAYRKNWYTFSFPRWSNKGRGRQNKWLEVVTNKKWFSKFGIIDTLCDLWCFCIKLKKQSVFKRSYISRADEDTDMVPLLAVFSYRKIDCITIVYSATISAKLFIVFNRVPLSRANYIPPKLASMTIEQMTANVK